MRWLDSLHRRSGGRFTGGFVALALALPGAAQASLGAGVHTVEVDRVNLGGTTVVTTAAGYQVHEITTPTARIREFIANGQVFAVSWYGHAVPDLGQLLGEHADAFRSLVQPQPGNHHAVEASNEKLLVSMRKLPRNMSGSVVVRSLVPAGVDFATLR